MNPPGNVMILASAGSGKTYELTNRFVQLLAGGAAPERIVALTFTRRAAGEFFDGILRKLAQAAEDPAAARTLAARIGHPGLSPSDFLRLLRTVIDAMPRLNLGTLDGFFARIVRAFPLELGLGGEFQLLEENAARLERRRVLLRLFAAADEPDAAQRDFLEAFKRATFGAEEKQLGRRLDAYLDAHTSAYLDAPDADQWGNPARIWPGGTEWLPAAADRAGAARRLRTALPGNALTAGQRTRLEDFLAALPGWEPGAPLPKPLAYLLERALAAWAGIRAGRAEITVDRKKVDFGPEACAALAEVVRGIVGAELARKLEVTRGLFALLRAYDTLYHGTVRRAGRLTFGDIQRVLLPATGAPVLTGVAAGESRLLIDWRLDAQFDHWLLDEFQDTSFAQWSILGNLLDEVVQDPERGRSFFYVGDVKQAIFAWREGDPRLFREIFRHYNGATENADPGSAAITERHLTASWRSGPAVIAMVNRLFGDEAALRNVVPGEAAERWAREWLAHTSVRSEPAGYAELRPASDLEDRFAETLRVLREVEPLRRGLSVAVLVQKNDTGLQLADYLRREGNLPAVAESDLRIARDNPLTCGLLALLHAAAHPGDRFAREHLAMTPLHDVLVAAGLGSPETVTMRLLAELQADGFATTLERWLEALIPKLAPEDTFSRTRGRQLVDLARIFDENGRREVAEFVEWAGSLAVRESEAVDVVRVLTVHKAKGLGFDLVILPDVGGDSLDRRRDGLAIQKSADRSVEWVLDLPGRIFCGQDVELGSYLAASEADAAYEALCKFYVAVTRAKQAVYVIAEPSGDSTSRNFPMLIGQTLGESWAEGDPKWYQAEPVAKERRPSVELAPIPESATARHHRLPSRRPSDSGQEVWLSQVFAASAAGAAEFGRNVHALFEAVEWWDQTQQEAWAARWRQEGADEVAVAEVLRCLSSPELAEVFRPEPGQVEVWRERSFEVVLDGVWLTGVFDRVMLKRTSAGEVSAALIVDFKTDRLAGSRDVPRVVARHAAQINLYRRVLAILTDLEEEQVECALVLTAEPSLRRIPAG